jgi:hypothetical protein
MHPDENPILQPEDYTKQYRENVESLKNKPELIQFDRMNYELFNSELGKKWIEYVTQTYLIPPSADRNHPNYSTVITWGEGFKDFGRMILQSVTSHAQRIKASEVKV